MLNYGGCGAPVPKGHALTERRQERRDRTYLGARIVFNHRASIAECIVRNLSAGGARLEFPSTVGLPGTFDLVIRHKGDSRRARMIWRTENTLGVVPEEPHVATVTSIEAARRLRQLEAERDRLAQRVRQLSEPF